VAARGVNLGGCGVQLDIDSEGANIHRYRLGAAAAVAACGVNPGLGGCVAASESEAIDVRRL
jgi:hypothetical protein